jgi:peptide/nickel transport system substrate-binding protein
MSLKKTTLFFVLAVALSLTLAACQNTPTVAPTATVGEATQPPATPTVEQPTPTPEPRSLVICLGQEPPTLYPFGTSSPATWSVLEAVYDGPFDLLDYQPSPVIFENMPSFENGAAALRPVSVRAGDEVVDANGELIALVAGSRVLPAGCSGSDCAVTWDGASELMMDQLALTYTLLPGVTWSDGQPLTAADSVYAYQVAGDPETPVSRYEFDRTMNYQALDEARVEWTGKPGYVPAHFGRTFWMPLPEHLWGGMSPAELLTAQQSARQPLGWGAYVVEEWVEGDHIQLVKNPNYFRAGEGLPYFDTLVFRFLGEAGDNNLSALLVNECDVVDQTSLLEEQIDPVLELAQDGQIQAHIVQTDELELIDFGVAPAAYDDGFDLLSGDRADLFGDVRVRQAFTYCMDRQGTVGDIFAEQASVPSGYLPANHPLAVENLPLLPYDVAAGAALLEEVGWRDVDGDPATPRQAFGIFGVPEGTSLSVDYLTTRAPIRVAMAEILAASMQPCGIEVNVLNLSPAELYTPGPEGPLFGRNFELAQFAWESGLQPACNLYLTDSIPNAGNNWLDVNITGFSDADYDAACQTALGTQLQSPAYAEAHAQAQRIYAEKLPSVPLYFRLKLAVARPDLCGLELNGSARSSLWNLEAVNYGEGCAVQ